MNKSMTAGEALAWVATRDKEFSALCRDETLIGVSLRLDAEFKGYFGSGKLDGIWPFHSGRTAAVSLVRSCRDGSVVAKGVRQSSYGSRPESDKFEEITPDDWSTLWLVERGDQIIAAPERKEGARQRSFTDWHFIRFDQADVLKAFPKRSVEESETSDATPFMPIAPIASQHRDQGPIANSSQPSSAKQTPQRPRTKSQNVVKAVKDIWGDGGPPADLMGGQRCAKINNWLKENGLAAVSDRQIRRALKDLPQV